MFGKQCSLIQNILDTFTSLLEIDFNVLCQVDHHPAKRNAIKLIVSKSTARKETLQTFENEMLPEQTNLL